MNKKVMYGLHNMFYFERIKNSYSIFTIFGCGYLSTAIFIFFIHRFLNFFWKVLAIVAKCFT